MDSTVAFPVKWFDAEQFSSLSGVVILDSTYQPPIILQLINEQGQVARTAFDTSFNFTLLPPGNYTAKISSTLTAIEFGQPVD